MPYEIKNVDGKYVLRKKHGDKKVFGRHPTREKAEAQLRAILANTHGEGANMPNTSGFHSLSQGRRVEVRRG